ncbi:MAG: hypothetical protein ABR593_08585 [Candidatus Limnocylindria bacterium]
MTDTPDTLENALADRDVSLAVTPGQLVLLVIGVFLLLRILRGLRR